TPMDESGANLGYRAIDSFFEHPRVCGLAEMMNAYGVIHNDAEVVSKIVASQAHHKKIDGHAPGLADKDLDTYVAAGVYSDHECSDVADALEKLKRGQFIMIREGTAARNLEALIPLLTPQYAERCMFCTDDKHPSDLLELGHIDYICKRAINEFGVDPILAVKVACHHAARYFQMNNRGAIAPGYLADFAIIDNFKDFNVKMVFKRGELYWDGKTLKDFPVPEIEAYLDERAHDTFHVSKLTEADFRDVRPRGVIGMIPGEIVTTDNGYADHVDLEKDILKIAVVERHKGTHHIGLGYIQGYGLKHGAVATSISHDSHNIIVVGTNSKDMAFAVNHIVENHGGITVVEDEQVKGDVQLEIAGLMSDQPLTDMNEKLENAKRAAFALGVNKGIDPFMTLSFMSLPVIPTLRLTTRGVIDVITQQYI
ncbi:MAG: amidohydrolase family protein, partial [Clostridia bacterium]|nr:amidohydrolase family protein [Clostridia bacterium]